jgi:MscS family membrane protein
LNRRLPVRLNEISDQPEGSLSHPAEPDKELIGTITSDSGDVDVLLERIDRKNAGSLWLFSRKTLDAIPELYSEANTESSQAPVIKFLLETKIAHIALIHWIGLFIGLPLLYFVGAWLNPLLSRLIGRLLRRLHKNPDMPNPEFLSMPVRLLLVACVIRWTLSAVTLPILAWQFWSSIAAIAAIAGCVWLIMRLNRWLEGKTRLRLGRRNLTGALSMLRFARWAVDGLIIFVGLLVFLHHFGIDPTTALAGLGVGGIAVALAAQKTLENVIAGVSLISDKAIRVGDFLKVGNTSGTIIDIGLRSTRIRTLDRTVVNVANGQIANASLENISLRDQFWFHHTLTLMYETTPSQMRSILERLTKLLVQRSDVDKPSVSARFLRFGTSSLDVEIFAYFSARDWCDFLRLQEELLLDVMDLVQAAGARIAIPSQTMYIANSAANGSDGENGDASIQRSTSTGR